LIVYADTSFLFSLYVPDANSSAAAAIMKRIKPALVATDFAEFEFINALNWRIFRKELQASEEQAVLLAFSKDLHAGVIRVVPISGSGDRALSGCANSLTPHGGTGRSLPCSCTPILPIFAAKPRS